jgi:predicted amidohydrolase
MTMMFKVSAVQAAPVFYDLPGSVDKAIHLIGLAAAGGCRLVAFGEAWLPGYPFHIWLGSPAWGMQFVDRYVENSVRLDGPEFARICAAAREAGIIVSIGYSERDKGSLYLGQALISETGEVLQARRKLKPTHVERTVFGEGYGADLGVCDTSIGRIGSLCCWEHIQPLSKYALFSQDEQIHIAGWPAFALYRGGAHALGAEVNMAVSQVHAVEGQCFVIAATSVVDPATLALLQQTGDMPPLLVPGGGAATIFGPDGRKLSTDLGESEEGLVFAELDMSQIRLAKSIADPAGHYAKPDATQLLLHRERPSPVVVRGGERPTFMPEPAPQATAGSEPPVA